MHPSRCLHNAHTACLFTAYPSSLHDSNFHHAPHTVCLLSFVHLPCTLASLPKPLSLPAPHCGSFFPVPQQVYTSPTHCCFLTLDHYSLYSTSCPIPLTLPHSGSVISAPSRYRQAPHTACLLSMSGPIEGTHWNANTERMKAAWDGVRDQPTNSVSSKCSHESAHGLGFSKLGGDNCHRSILYHMLQPIY